MSIKEALPGLLHNCSLEWQPITTAPYDVDLEVAVVDGAEIHALVFPCRRNLQRWINARSEASVQIHPTHWRKWE